MPLLMCDLDDTLVERPPLFRAWAEGFLQEHGRPDLLDWMVQEDHGGHRPREDFLAAIAERTGYDVTPEEFLREFRTGVGQSYRLTEGVRSALADAHSQGWAFAVVTNGPQDQQSEKIRAAGLDEIADAICISGEIGHPKPHEAMFRTAAARAGTTLEGAWMIGDNLDADIAGAQGVGVRSVWVKRPYEWLTYESGAEPDLIASDFPDAVAQVLAATG